MSNDQTGTRGADIARELIVPLIMLCGVGLYAWDVRGLSIDGLAFPLGLMTVIVIASIAIIVRAVIRTELAHRDQTAGPLHAARPLLLVLVPIPLILLWDYVGALVVLVGLVMVAQILLGGRSPLRILVFSVLAATPVYFLFKYVFYVRFPSGLLGIG